MLATLPMLGTTPMLGRALRARQCNQVVTPNPHPDPHPHPALDPDPNPDPGPNPDPDPDPDPDPNQVSSGAEPLWLAPEYDAQSGLCLGLRARAVERALHAGGARVAAVLVVSD